MKARDSNSSPKKLNRSKRGGTKRRACGAQRSWSLAHFFARVALPRGLRAAAQQHADAQQAGAGEGAYAAEQQGLRHFRARCDYRLRRGGSRAGRGGSVDDGVTDGVAVSMGVKVAVAVGEAV